VTPKMLIIILNTSFPIPVSAFEVDGENRVIETVDTNRNAATANENFEL
jgi:hypothetical protein